MQIPHEQITKSPNKSKGSANNNSTYIGIDVTIRYYKNKILRINGLKHTFFFLFIFHFFILLNLNTLFKHSWFLLLIACSFSSEPFDWIPSTDKKNNDILCECLCECINVDSNQKRKHINTVRSNRSAPQLSMPIKAKEQPKSMHNTRSQQYTHIHFAYFVCTLKFIYTNS